VSYHPPRNLEGPFRAEQLEDGDPYELVNGHPVECLPAGGRHAKANLTGSLALGTDPEVEEAGVDAGYSPGAKDLHAPDIAIGNVPDEPGWVPGVPPLAVEYADAGQDEAALRDKVASLLAAGTRYVWVVRLRGPRRVEVHEPGQAIRVLGPGETLAAPGVLRNPVAVDALYDPAAAQDAALRNLLQRQGYDNLDAVRAEAHSAGRVEGHAEGVGAGELAMVLRLLKRRLAVLSDHEEQRIRGLPPERIEALGEALLDFRTPADLGDWLEREG